MRAGLAPRRQQWQDQHHGHGSGRRSSSSPSPSSASRWRESVDAKARAMLAEAMVVQEARVMPPAPPSHHPTAPAPAPAPQPGTYPTEKAKLEAALPKFLAAADAYPSSDSGQTARYHAASALVGLGRFDEAMRNTIESSATARGCCRRWRASARRKRSCAARSPTQRSPVQGALRTHRQPQFPRKRCCWSWPALTSRRQDRGRAQDAHPDRRAACASRRSRPRRRPNWRRSGRARRARRGIG